MTTTRLLSVLVLVIGLSSLSCSDFSNNAKSGNGSAPIGPVDPKPEGGSNSFPVGFDPNAGEYSEAALLANIGLNVIAPQTQRFRLRAENLEMSVGELCTALAGQGDTQEAERAAQDQWRSTMLAYHKLDSAPFGPVMDNGRVLLDNIYGWPNFNPCGIDLEVVKLKKTGTPNEHVLFTLRGLGAIEYLLFENQLTTACNPRNASHKPAFEWTELPTREKKADRCLYARQLTHDLSDRAKKLETAWDPKGANFSKTLVDGSRYTDVHEAVNELSDAMFAIEVMKDARVGKPLGLNKDCISPDGKCPQMAEHPYSGLALPAMLARLDAFEELLLGSTSTNEKRFGFDDALKVMGRDDVTAHLREYISKARTTASALNAQGRLQDQIAAMDAAQCKATSEDDPRVPLCLLYRQLRQLTVKMKTEFLVALSLRAPIVHQGDND